MDILSIRRLGTIALALCAAAPLAAQGHARALPACIQEASATAPPELVRYGCAGGPRERAVRFSVSLPASWQVAWQDTADLVLTAEDGDNVIWVVGGDQLPDPVNRADTAAFWTRATQRLLGREASAAEVEAFRDASNGRIASARARITHAVLADSALRAEVMGLSTASGAAPAPSQEAGVRALAGEPAGYLSEVMVAGGREWRMISYVTMRDGAIFAISLNGPEGGHTALLPLWERVLASFDPRTERW
jgi:hypothetical protein